MKAKEAKELAEKNKQRKLISKKTEADKEHDENVDLLYKHLLTKVDEAVSKGHSSTEAAGVKIEFPDNRFTNEVIAEVVSKLREDGYNVNKDHYIAYRLNRFYISWV